MQTTQLDVPIPALITKKKSEALYNGGRGVSTDLN